MINYEIAYKNDHLIPSWFTRTCPTGVVAATIDRAQALFSRVLKPLSQAANFHFSEKFAETNTLCLLNENCFEIASQSVLEQVAKSGQVINNVAELTIRVSQVEGYSLYKVLFGPAKELFYKCWLDGQKVCESIIHSNSEPLAKQCYEGPFEGRLLRQVCTYSGTLIEPKIESAWAASAQVIGGLVSLFFLYKSVRAYLDEGKGAQANPVKWAILSAGALIAPFYMV